MEADNSQPQPIKDDVKAATGNAPKPSSYFANLGYLLQNCRLKIKPESTTKKTVHNGDNDENLNSQEIEPQKSTSPSPTKFSEETQPEATIETEKAKSKSDSESNASFKSCDEPGEESRPSEDDLDEYIEVPKCRTFLAKEIFEELDAKMKREEEAWLNEVIGSPSDFKDCQSDTPHESESEDDEQIATEGKEEINSLEDDAEDTHTEEEPFKQNSEQQETAVDETNDSFDDGDASVEPENTKAPENFTELNTTEAEVTSPQDTPVDVEDDHSEVQSELPNEVKTSTEEINSSPEEFHKEFTTEIQKCEDVEENILPEESPKDNGDHDDECDDDEIMSPERIRIRQDILVSSDQESEVEADIACTTSADINQDHEKQQEPPKPRMKRCCVSISRCDRLVKQPKLDVQTSSKPLSSNKINLDEASEMKENHDEDKTDNVKVYSMPLSRAASRMASIDSDDDVKSQAKTTAGKEKTKKIKKTKAKSKPLSRAASRMASIDSDVKVENQAKKQKYVADKEKTKKIKKTKAKSKLSESKAKVEKKKAGKSKDDTSSSSSGLKKNKPKLKSCEVSVVRCDKPSKLRVSMKTLGVTVRCPFCARLCKTWKKFNDHQRKKHKKSQRKA